MPIELRPAEAKDVPRMAELLFAAFESDPLHVAMLPREHTDSIMDWYQGRLRSALTDPNMRTMIAVDLRHEADGDPKEVIVGYSRWLLPLREHEDTEKRNEMSVVAFPQTANKPLVDFYLQQCDDKREKQMDKSRDIVLYVLATDPAYQGQGIGRKMLEWGINTAATLSMSSQNETRRILLEATPLAYPVYRKFGWKDYSSITIDLKQYGINNAIEHTTVCMIRK
jgi:GNAT superfamily N-acetyltransferase